MLSQWLKQSAYTVVFTGAGMSPTPLDAYANLVVNQQRIGDYLQDIANQLN